VAVTTVTSNNDAGLWFEDGNLIVLAGETSFKVHRSVLSRVSPKLSSFINNVGSNGPRAEDQLPVVCFPVPPAELRDFLSVIYNGLKYHQERPEWSVVRAMLNLGKLFEVAEYFEEGYKHLEELYPANIYARDCLLQGKPHMRHSPEDSIAIANLARNLSLEDMHRSALYDCCQLTSENLVQGSSGGVEKLGDADLMVCMEARRNLSLAKYELFQSLFAEANSAPPEDCQRPSECSVARQALHEKIRYETDFLVAHNPLDNHAYWIREFCGGSQVEGEQSTRIGMCDDCINFYVMRHTVKRQEILDNLRNCFPL